MNFLEIVFALDMLIIFLGIEFTLVFVLFLNLLVSIYNYSIRICVIYTYIRN